MTLEVESKTELLMLLVALENSSDLILKDERAEEWHERAYTSLFNRITYEYASIADDEEDALIALLAN